MKSITLKSDSLTEHRSRAETTPFVEIGDDQMSAIEIDSIVKLQSKKSRQPKAIHRTQVMPSSSKGSRKKLDEILGDTLRSGFSSQNYQASGESDDVKYRTE